MGKIPGHIRIPTRVSFQAGISPFMTLITMHDKISIAFENNELSIGVFFDLAKAFDTVNNDILLYELATYGVRGIQLKWFESYIQISLHRKLRNMCVYLTGCFICFPIQSGYIIQLICLTLSLIIIVI